MDVRYHKAKIAAQSPEMQEEYIKKLKEQERLEYWRREVLKAYRDQSQGTFLISEVV